MSEEQCNYEMKGSTLYYRYIEKFPKSTVARDQNYPASGGHFSYNLYQGKYNEAWFRADGGNKMRMLSIGFVPDWADRDLTPNRFCQMVTSIINYQDQIGNIDLQNIHHRE